MPKRTPHIQTPQKLEAIATEITRLAATLTAAADAMRAQELDEVVCYNLSELKVGLKKITSFVDVVPRMVRETLFDVGSLGEQSETASPVGIADDDG